MSLKLTSSAFTHGEPIPKKYTGEGIDVSPPLGWSGVPDGTREFALICDDPDAPTPEPWVHWIIYHLPADLQSLPENVAPDAQVAQLAGARQGENSWTSGRRIGYRGPFPPKEHGVHHYHFRLYALDAAINAPAKADKQSLLQAMANHVLAEAVLTGTYER